MGELQAFAALPLSDLAAPAIHLADEGFPFYQHMHDKIVAHLDSLNISDASAEIYLNEARTGPKFEVGETFTNPHLADTMRELAGKGWQWYYSHLADEIIDAANSAVEPHTGRHGLLQKSDFEHYKAVRRNAVRKQLRNDLEYVGMSFPSSGGTSLAMMLKMWNVFPSSADDLGSVLEGSNDKNWTFEEARRMVDVQNTVWADRQKYMGDADFVDVPEGLLDDEYIAERRKEWVACLDAEGCSPSPTRGSEIPVPFGTPPGVEVSTTFVDRGSDRMSTTHFSIADREGNFLSMTTTIEENFGTGVTVPGRGFLLNNELTDFSFRPYPSGTGPAHAYPNAPSGERKRRRTAVGEDANTIGGKRPMSSMSPSLIFSNNEPIAAFGSPGGTRIIGSVFNALVQYLSRGASLFQAVERERMVAKNDVVYYETSYDPDYILELSALGFETSRLPAARPMPYVEAVIRKGSCYGGVADSSRFEMAEAALVE
mmetsp:Transcript_15665/g.39779  ORF Transcript_15665/g.39779 Transcript_15665/m.39779 type:complete len:485 (+) Transcript_15665:372-1826(+)